MTEFEIPHFGKINTSSLEDYYEVDIEFGSGAIQIDLNFENKSIESKELEIISSFIKEICALDEKNKLYIREDYNDSDGDTVRFYLEHHVEECSKEELSGLVDFENNVNSLETQLLNKLHLIRVGFYPDGEETFAVFDYSIGSDITNYLVVVNEDKHGELDYLTMES